MEGGDDRPSRVDIQSLSAQSKNINLEFGEFLVMIPEVARLRGTSTRARDQIPSFGQRLPGHPGHWIAVDNSSSRSNIGKTDHLSGR
jgi:hypothetical protein